MNRLRRELEFLAESLPPKLVEIIDKIRLGKMEFALNHHGITRSVNRLSMGIIISALFLGSSLMLSLRVPPLLFPEPSSMGLHQVSAFGMLGVLYSFFWTNEHSITSSRKHQPP